MAPLLVTTTFQHLSGLARDRVVNTWAFTTPTLAATLPEALDCIHAVEDFYNTVPSGHNAVAALIAPCISRVAGAHINSVFDLTGHLSGTPHGSPILSTTFSLGPETDPNGLPAEVAICLSFHTAYGFDAEFAGATRPRARDRGRVYIGPLIRGVMSVESGTNRMRPSTSTQESITLGARRLIADTTNAWSVWSRKNATIDPVTDAWVDDAFDTQRRRGERPTSRVLA